MKKLAIIIPVILILTCFITPAFASDPPDTNVDVVVVSPGDVDLNVGINAGGDVDVTVDGVNLDQMAQSIADLYSRGGIDYNDLLRFVHKNLDPLFAKLFLSSDTANQNIDLLTQAISKLIMSDDLAHQQIGVVSHDVSSLATQAYNNDMANSNRIDALRQLLSDYFNSLLDTQAGQLLLINNLRADVDQANDTARQLREDLTTTNANLAAETEYANWVGQHYLYYIWMLAAGGVILLGTVAFLIFKLSKITRG